MMAWRMLLCLGMGLCLSGCSHEAKQRFGEALLLDRSAPQFTVNAVRPIWSCERSPDPRYPCVGLGPEGFVRDLVARPFANKRVMTIKDVNRNIFYRLRFTWFSMQGSCDGSVWDEQLQGFIWPVVLTDGRTFYERSKQEVNLTRLSAEKILEASLAKGYGRNMVLRELPDGSLGYLPHFPPNLQCTAHHIDLYAGKPFGMAAKIYAPEPEDPAIYGDDWIKPSTKGLFDTGCREEQRNGLTWRVCVGAMERQDRRNGTPYEAKRERWVTPLGDSGFVLLIWAGHRDFLFQWPQWLAERQAAQLEVIDSVRIERLPLAGNEPNLEKEWPLR